MMARSRNQSTPLRVYLQKDAGMVVNGDLGFIARLAVHARMPARSTDLESTVTG